MIFDDCWWCLMMFDDVFISFWYSHVLLLPYQNKLRPLPCCVTLPGIRRNFALHFTKFRQFRLWKSCIHCIHHWSFSREQWTSRGWVQWSLEGFRQADKAATSFSYALHQAVQSNEAGWQNTRAKLHEHTLPCRRSARSTCANRIWMNLMWSVTDLANGWQVKHGRVGHFSLAIATVQVVPLQLSLDFLQESESSCGTLLGLKGYAPEAILDDVGYIGWYSRWMIRPRQSEILL